MHNTVSFQKKIRQVQIGSLTVGPDSPLTIISGPCVIESEEHALFTAKELIKLRDKYGFQLIYKSSYDKANRSSNKSFRGPGLKKGLAILKKVRDTFHVPITTDIHEVSHVNPASEVCDLLQIPAFLCRQTDLVIAAAETGKCVNIKKGQFMAPWDMKNAVEKVESVGNQNVILTDRGVTFGYNNLVSDMRAIPIMQGFGVPVCFDASHSVQLPGGLGDKSGGQREFIPTLAKCALAAGANLLFIESHPNPAEAKSDAASVMALEELERLIPIFQEFYRIAKL